MKKHEFKKGDYVRVDSPMQRDNVIELLRSRGYGIDYYNCMRDEEDAVRFNKNGSFNSCIAHLIEDDRDCVEIPYNDFITLASGKLPESYSIRMTTASLAHPSWDSFEESLGVDFYYILRDEYDYFVTNGGNNDSPNICINCVSVEITIETWAAIQELKEEMTPPISGGVTQVDPSQLEFDPSKPFEVSYNGKDWITEDTSYGKIVKYIGINSCGLNVIEFDESYMDFEHIRNVQQRFEKSEPIWANFEGTPDHVWHIGNYDQVNTDGKHVANWFGEPRVCRKIHDVTDSNGKPVYPPNFE